MIAKNFFPSLVYLENQEILSMYSKHPFTNFNESCLKKHAMCRQKGIKTLLILSKFFKFVI